MNITGIVIAGGRSSRMGRNKALLPIGGIPLVERVVRALEVCTSRILIAANEAAPYAYLDKEIVPDQYAHAGPLAGIHAGLTASQTSWNLITACDMPFMNTKLLRRLISAAERADEGVHQDDLGIKEAVIPLSAHGMLPLLAMYKRSVLPSLEASLKQDQLRLLTWAQSLQAVWVPQQALCRDSGLTEEMLSFNMNRPGDYERACLLMKE